MPKNYEELLTEKRQLENTVKQYETQIHLIEKELTLLHTPSTQNSVEINEPQAPWNLEHEGIINHDHDYDVHLFEREQIYENLHE